MSGLFKKCVPGCAPGSLPLIFKLASLNAQWGTPRCHRFPGTELARDKELSTMYMYFTTVKLWISLVPALKLKQNLTNFKCTFKISRDWDLYRT